MAHPEVEVDALAAGGRGVGRRDGVVWFVAGAVPGDRVRARVERRRPGFVEARAVELLRPGPSRRPADCPIQVRCGGCPWMVLPEEVQRGWKRRLVQDALERIGRFREPPVEPTIASPASLGYRYRAEPVLAAGVAGAPVLGFRGPEGGAVDTERCAVLAEPGNRVLAALRGWLLDGRRDAVTSAVAAGACFRIGIRVSRADGGVLVALHDAAVPFPDADLLARQLHGACADVRGVLRVRGRAGRRGGARVRRLAGAASLRERIAGIDYDVPALTFLQVNPLLAGLLVECVTGFAGEVAGRRVLDLYGGVGVFGLALASLGARATICEADAAAVACGKRAAARHGMAGVSWQRGDVRRWLERPAVGAADLVVANPPRGGLGAGVVDAIAERRPGRIVLVSCDPATGARDLRRLADHGYRLRAVQPLDMFPQTAHVESVSLLER